MNSRSPAFQFYPADYLSDANVQSMSIEGEGVYIRLLCYCWKDGSIPADREAIAKLCKGYRGRGINEALSCFIPAMKIRKNSKLTGRLVHKRLLTEKAKQQRWHKSMKTAGLEGARKRWLSHSQAIAKPMATPMAKNASSSSSSSSSSNNKDNINNILCHLNQQTGKKFKTDSGGFISARLKEGFTLDDFKKVIDIKVAKWKDDPKMNDFLRPSTLFRPSNFEAYLNEQMQDKKNLQTGHHKEDKPKTEKEQAWEKERELLEKRLIKNGVDLEERKKIIADHSQEYWEKEEK